MQSPGVNFLGISLTDTSLVEKLNQFLTKHEEMIGYALVTQVQQFSRGKDLIEGEARPINFQTAIEQIQTIFRDSKDAKRWSSQPQAWQTLIKNLNSILWEQIELIEGFVNELFHQLSFVNILHWQPNLKESVDQCEATLLQHINLTKKLVQKLQDILHNPEKKSKDGKIDTWLSHLWRPWKNNGGIESDMVSDLENTEKTLKRHTQEFREHWHLFQSLSEEINPQIQKLRNYEVLSHLGETSVETFSSLYKFVKLYEGLTASTKNLPSSLFYSFQSLSKDKTLLFFKKYAFALEEALFEKSRVLKTSPKELFSDAHGRSFLLDTVKGYKKEVHALGFTATKLNDFLLKSHPDPYVRARLGFTDTPLGQTPPYSQKLINFNLSVQQLDSYYDRLILALEQGPSEESERQLIDIEDQIDHYLHYLAHPFISSAHFKGYAEKIISLVEEINEIGGFGREVVDYVRYVLGRLLRVDWKDHILTTLPRFQNIYRIHQGILGPCVDQAHEKRLQKFEHFFYQIKTKLHQDNHKNTHDMDYDISDIQGYLQDFLATLQRSLKEEIADQKRSRRHLEEAIQQLVEYRFLFGKFFVSLKNEPEWPYLQQRFLFVDQYFEAVENKVYEFKLQKGFVGAETD